MTVKKHLKIVIWEGTNDLYLQKTQTQSAVIKSLLLKEWIGLVCVTPEAGEISEGWKSQGIWFQMDTGKKLQKQEMPTPGP